MPHTIQLHRVLCAPPEKVYRAFLNPEAMVKWFPPHGFTAQLHSIDAQVGGGYKMSFTNFTTGKKHSFGGKYVELVPDKLIKYTDQFDDPHLPGEMHVSIMLNKVSCGTDLKIVQEGIPEVIPIEMCYLGWQQSLNLLSQLIEPNLPDEG